MDNRSKGGSQRGSKYSFERRLKDASDRGSGFDSETSSRSGSKRRSKGCSERNDQNPEHCGMKIKSLRGANKIPIHGPFDDEVQEPFHDQCDNQAKVPVLDHAGKQATESAHEHADDKGEELNRGHIHEEVGGDGVVPRDLELEDVRGTRQIPIRSKKKSKAPAKKTNEQSESRDGKYPCIKSAENSTPVEIGSGDRSSTTSAKKSTPLKEVKAAEKVEDKSSSMRANALVRKKVNGRSEYFVRRGDRLCPLPLR